MEAAVAEARRQVAALQRGAPAEAQAAGRRLAELQQGRDAVPLCAVLLRAALSAGDHPAAFFAAQTLATRARLCGDAERAAWAPVARELLTILATAARAPPSGAAVLAVPTLRQLCAALARLCAQLADEWPDAVDSALSQLGEVSNTGPLLEVLQALAEEPFSRRLLVDGARRSRFLLAFRGKVGAVLGAVGAAARAQPGAPALRCASAWLRAQPFFEEWLPMVGFDAAGGSGEHVALGLLAPVFAPPAVAAARLEFGLEAFEAAAELVEAALPLAGSLAAEAGASAVVLLLEAFCATCARLAGGVAGDGNTTGLPEVAGALLTVQHAAFSSEAALLHGHLRTRLLTMGATLLAFAGPGSGGGLGPHAIDCEGGALGRALDAWEAPAAPRQADGDDFQAPLAAQPPDLAGALDETFAQLLASLPQALALSPALRAAPEECDLSQLRSRVSQLLIVWCDANSKRTAALLALLTGLCGRLQPLDSGLTGGGLSTPTACAELELVLTLATAAAEVLASSGEVHQLPEPLPQLCAGLPLMPLGAAPAPWARLLEASAAELVAALDPWIRPDRGPPSESSRKLVSLAFRLASSQHAGGSAVDALAVVVSNLAEQLAADSQTAEECFARLREICLGSGGLPFSLRERLVTSAVGPLLSSLPEQQLALAVEALAAPLRAASPPSCAPGPPTPDSVAASRLLFHVLAAPQPPQADVRLEWLSKHWQWFEAALVPPAAVEQTIEAACHLLTTTLSAGRGSTAFEGALHRACPLLVDAAAGRGSVAALSALTFTVRVSKGGGTNAALACELAAQAATVAERLLGGVGHSAEQLPPDLFATLLELFTVALAPRCKLLSLHLLSTGAALGALVASTLSALPSFTSPRIVCWGLLLCERLPQWLQQAEFQPHAQNLVSGILPAFASSTCGLLAGSPVAQDSQVREALAKALLAMFRAAPAAVLGALGEAMGAIAVPAEERELFLQQLGDPALSEDLLSEALGETADSWQADHLRRALAS
ncbi:unnamed protein product [Prorocentrum cordatum]|uniref:Uncharacterized protein n=1 Tax=Prorocentrum cordatum TaxID=2364126 RepID=A0ABN9QD36_9DINO|nr:unnamed protein product [Polarella glacialis]